MKKKAWLIHNASIATTKFLQVNALYVDAAKRKNIALELVSSADIYSLVFENKVKIKSSIDSVPEFVLFLDKDIRLAQHLEMIGYRVFNSSDTIRCCDDKALMAQLLSGHGIKLPKTLFSHLHYAGYLNESDEYKVKAINNIESFFSYPLVMKEVNGSFGSQVYLINNRAELIKKRQEILYNPHLYQEFISSSFGRDVRIHVVGDRVVASMLRTSKNDFRANISHGGLMQIFDPPIEFKKMAIKASKILQADFTGVDILFGYENEPILCEVNSNAHIKNIYDCTGIDVAECILDYILENL